MSDVLPVHAIEDWQMQLQQAITSVEELLAMLQLSPTQVSYSPQADRDFALKVPLSFARRMRIGDPNDPLLLQILASTAETRVVEGYSADPVGELGETIPRPGIIHKYRGRALLVVTGACAINCRYCFRRHFPYADNRNNRNEWREALNYIRDDNSVEEVIFSGGDPLVASDTLLRELAEHVTAIPHVRRLRIHSRLPIVLPDRVTTNLLDAICQPGLQTIMVVHANHRQELDDDVAGAVMAMRDRNITVLNQSVLLKGINDDVRTLADLSDRLIAVGILPYYLHLLDKVQGAAHFDLSAARAKKLIAGLEERLPGYLVPKLVREDAGAASKTPVGAWSPDN